MSRRPGPRIYNLFPLLAGPVTDWSRRLPAVAGMGFDTVFVNAFFAAGPSGNIYEAADFRRLDPRFGGGTQAQEERLLRHFTGEAVQQGLTPMMDLVVTHAAPDGVLAREHPDWFRQGGLLDWMGRWRDDIARYFVNLVRFYLSLGFRGFRCISAHRLPAEAWRRIIDSGRAMEPACFFCAETLGRPEDQVLALAGAGFDFLFNSVRWWNGRDSWFPERQAVYRRVAPSIGFPESFEEPRLREELAELNDPTALAAEYARRYMMAATLSAGVLMPMGFETGAGRPLDPRTTTPDDGEPPLFDLSPFIAQVNRVKADCPSLHQGDQLSRLSAPDDPVTYLARQAEAAEEVAYLAINTDRSVSRTVDADGPLAMLEGRLVALEEITPGREPGPDPMPQLELRPGELRLLRAAVRTGYREGAAVTRSDPPSRLIIEKVAPEIDGGRHPVKRILGDRLEVSADIFRDGHDVIAAALRLQLPGETDWGVYPLTFIDNDRWGGGAVLERMGRARYTIEAWTDPFASWRDEALKKRAAGQGLALELIEGRHLLEAAVARADDPLRHKLQGFLARCDQLPTQEAQADLLLSHMVALGASLAPDKSDRRIYEPMLEVPFLEVPFLEVIVDREAARFSAWYEMFPRSQGTDPHRSATFADCIRRLAEIRDLGFDVLYLVPIHPIGAINRKGRNNSPVAGPEDPGSPYAIADHLAIDPGLGSLAEFRAFVTQVRAHGMELALDFAVQCAPDHPWLKEHPAWFRLRPDGSVKYAENPPKKYEDIVNVDFDQPDWRSLWQALADVVRVWIREGVRIFRVDNPHTKPSPFWHWLIAEIQREDPGILFLAEAFTRPKMMRHLAKIGFSQSYTYFTWRNSKRELTDYLTELTRTEMAETYRPNFFTNTPDILPFFLQTGGRPGFRIRLVLAATLSPAYGIYNGFELCEAGALPGREEYAFSEKYEFKVWDWDRPGHIKDDIAKLNRLRRESPALRLFTNLVFHEAGDERVLFYSKTGSSEAEAVFVAVTLDPFRTVRTEIVFPYQEGFETVELFSGWRQAWSGPRHVITLDPQVQPALVLSVVSR